MMLTLTISLMLSMMFPILKHPLSMGMILILQTITVSLITGMISNMFWYSLILIITMISGMLVLFIYMASIASNEKFDSSIKLIQLSLLMITIGMIMWMMTDQMETSLLNSKMTTENLSISLMKMFNYHNMSLTILLVSYLFFTMIAISYVVNVFEGPLRTKN
uniref:NADH-ubiquinone oxidoreductase chain 6 n=1 Tax=Camarochiloides weiweii TaxID=2785926 RepID=A0A873QI39_9HEMI|nr:NADH dehydrogenase subunit 6 [Camarochiloides weiweii]